MRKKLSAILLAVLLCAGCGADVEETPPARFGYSGSVMLFCSMQEEQILAIKKGFEEKYPGITMDYYFSSTSKVLTKLATERQSGKITADVIWTGDPSDYIDLKATHTLSPYISPQAININETFMDEQHYYIGGRLMSVVIAYNTDLVAEDEVPRTWEDLLDPKWKGRIVMTDPKGAGSTKYFVSSLMGASGYGPAFFSGLYDNGCMLESSTAATHQRVADGTYAIGICLDYIVSNLKDQGRPIALHYPEEDLITIYCPMGIVAGCPNEYNGRLLYDFILSKEGQSILVDNHLRSIRDDVEQDGPSIQTILDTRFPTDDQQISDTADELLAEFDRIFFHT